MRIVLFAFLSVMTTVTGHAGTINALAPGELVPGDQINVFTFDGMVANRYGSTSPAGSFQLGDALFSGSALIVRNGEDGLLPALGLYAEPYHDVSNYMAVLGTGSETIAFASERRKFGFYWGSIDSYNNISFFMRGIEITSYNGTDLTPLFPIPFGDQHEDNSNRYITFSGMGDFDTVVISSGGNSFELDNISSSVPEPATWLMLLVGFASMYVASLKSHINGSVFGTMGRV